MKTTKVKTTIWDVAIILCNVCVTVASTLMAVEGTKRVIEKIKGEHK